MNAKSFATAFFACTNAVQMRDLLARMGEEQLGTLRDAGQILVDMGERRLDAWRLYHRRVSALERIVEDDFRFNRDVLREYEANGLTHEQLNILIAMKGGVDFNERSGWVLACRIANTFPRFVLKVAPFDRQTCRFGKGFILSEAGEKWLEYELQTRKQAEVSHATGA